LLSNDNKKVRDSAAEAFNDVLRKNIDVAEQEINSIMFNKKIDDEIRKMPRPDYSRHLGDDIESEIVDDLVQAVSEKFDISKRYYKLKAKLLGLKKLKYHERNLNYGKIEKKYSYKESVSLVYNMLMNLDKDFGEIFKRFVEKGQIDVYPKKGKRMGGFCSYRSRLPVYVCLNYDNKIEDVRVIAHELGHGINFELMKKQKSLNMKLSLATAEAASTFMEDFALKEILKDADDESKLALMMMRLNDNVSSIMRQVACYLFEQELHKSFREKGYLSKEEIGKIFQKHMKEYMGEAVEQSEGSQNWWAYWGQIRQFFYNYSYASGLLISKALQDSVKKQPEFIGKVKEFLSAGSSESPKNIFKKMGILLDKEFWTKGLNEVENLLNETEQLAKKLGKI
jgi:oligoendopeptidase F